MSKKLLLIVVGVLGSIAFFNFGLPRIMIIHETSCSSQYGSCPEALIKTLSMSEGHSLELARKEIGIAIGNNYHIQDSKLKFAPLDRLEVRIVLRKAVAGVSVLGYQDDLNKTALIDSEGMVLGFVDDTSLPRVYIESDMVNLGEFFGDEVNFASALLRYLFPIYKAKSGILKEDGFYVALDDMNQVIFPNHGEAERLIASLQLVMGSAKIDEDQKGLPLTLDLRFNNPVIRKSQDLLNEDNTKNNEQE